MLRDDIELCNENDEADPDYGPAESWGLWADRDVYELGPGLPLTDAEDLALLRQVERTPWQDFLAAPAEPQP
jgi:hypothetical protein